MRDQLHDATIRAGDVQGGPRGVQGHGHLVEAPSSLEVNRLGIEDDQQLELANLHRLVEGRLHGILGDLALLCREPASESPNPVGAVRAKSMCSSVLQHAIGESDDRRAPPVAQEPGWRLWLACEHLDKGTLPRLRHRQKEVLAEVVKVEEVDS